MVLNEILSVLNGYEIVGIKAYVDEWRSYDCLKGVLATLFIGQQQITGIIQGIDDNGLLLMEKTDGILRAFASGEVSFSAAT
jgi:BirA family biotin operon repressor/biotin-[acetyl-CoA-carboxylase] ligase